MPIDRLHEFHFQDLQYLADYVNCGPKGFIGSWHSRPACIPNVVAKVVIVVKELFCRLASLIFPAFADAKQELRNYVVRTCLEANTSAVSVSELLVKDSKEQKLWNEEMYQAQQQVNTRLGSIFERMQNRTCWDKITKTEFSEEEQDEVEGLVEEAKTRSDALQQLRQEYTPLSIKSNLFIWTQVLSQVDKTKLEQALTNSRYFQERPEEAVRWLTAFSKTQQLPKALIDGFPNNFELLTHLVDFAKECHPAMAVSCQKFLDDNCVRFKWAGKVEFLAPLERIKDLSNAHYTGLNSGFREGLNKVVELDPDLSAEAVQAIQQYWQNLTVDKKLETFSAENWQTVTLLLHYAQGSCPSMVAEITKIFSKQLDSPDCTSRLIIDNIAIILLLNKFEAESMHCIHEKLDRLVFQIIVRNFSDIHYDIGSTPLKDYKFRVLDIPDDKRFPYLLCDVPFVERMWNQIQPQFAHLKHLKILFENKPFLELLSKTCINEIEQLTYTPLYDTYRFFQNAPNLRAFSLVAYGFIRSSLSNITSFIPPRHLVKSLSLEHGKFEHFFEGIQEFSQLEVVDFSGGDPNGEEYLDGKGKFLTMSCPHIHTLTVKNQKHFQDGSLDLMLQKLPQLRKLDIRGCTQVTKFLLEHFRKLYPHVQIISD